MSGSRSLVSEVKRLELRYLVKNGFIKRGMVMRGSYSWISSGNWGKEKSGEITIEATYPPDEAPRIRLLYSITSREGKKIDYDYTIDTIERPSNLGKGSVLYFLCPETGKPCRILYLAYGYPRFISREAYTGRCRLYYEPQLDSHRDRANTVYWRIERQLEEMKKKRYTYTYRNKYTRRAIRMERLRIKRDEADLLRWGPMSFPAWLGKEIFKGLV